MSEKIYKFALIGVGRAGKNFINTINKMENCQITHLVTSNPDNAKLCKNKVKILKSHHDVCSLPGAGGVDGVIVAVPNESHSIILQDCLYALLPTLIEKPMGANLIETLGLRQSVYASKVPVLVGHTQTFSAAYQELCGYFKAAKPKKITSKFRSYGPFRKNATIVWDFLVHEISMVLNLLNMEAPIEVEAHLESHKNYPNSGELDVKLKFKSTEVSININNLATQKYRSFIAENAWTCLSLFDEELYDVRESRSNKIHLPSERPLHREINAFIEAIETNSYVGVELAVEVARVLDRCQNYLDIHTEPEEE